MAHVVTGYMPTDRGPRSAYFARNVRDERVEEVVQGAIDAGWTNVEASPESF